jgi:hypothetical protein
MQIHNRTVFFGDLRCRFFGAKADHIDTSMPHFDLDGEGRRELSDWTPFEHRDVPRRPTALRSWTK